MAVIFVFSTSNFGADETGSVLEAIIVWLYPSASVQFLEEAHFLVRKAAHFSEYALLAFLWFRALADGQRHDVVRAIGLSFAICALYAVTDEFHQSFVPDRTASPVDVLIDSSGAAFALIAISASIKKRATKRA